MRLIIQRRVGHGDSGVCNKPPAIDLIACTFNAIQTITQLFACLEEGHKFLRNSDIFACAWIASLTRFALLDGKSAEAAQFDTAVARQSVRDFVKDGVHNALNIAL